MEAIYFPHTVIPEPVLANLEHLVDSVEVLQPCRREVPEFMAAYAAKGFLSIYTVMADHKARLEAALQGFEAFAQTAGPGGDLVTRFVALSKGSPAPDDERVASQIVSAMKRGRAGTRRPPEDPAFEAALFLFMAQTYDLRNMEVQKDLKSAGDTQKKLFQSLTGEVPMDEKTDFPGHDAPDDYMPRQRLAAWSNLFFNRRALQGMDKGPVWMTHSRPVVEHLLEEAPFSVQTVHLEATPGAPVPEGRQDPWKAAFQEALSRAWEDPGFCLDDPLVEASIPFGGPAPFAATVHAVHQAPAALFGRRLDGSLIPEGQEALDGKTLLVCLDP